MKDTQLDDLLNQITPLPWYREGISAIALGERHAIYLAHAANVLPEVVKALEIAQRQICALTGCSKMLNQHTPGCLAAKKALILAQTV